MKVIDHEPQTWFLLEDGENLLFDVACEFSCVGYNVLIVLNEEESKGYQAKGHAYLNKLADVINCSVPGAKASSSPYKARNIQPLRGDAVLHAIHLWQKTSQTL